MLIRELRAMSHWLSYAKFGEKHQPLGYYRLNDESVSNISGFLLAQQNERRLYDRREFENIRQQSIAFKLLSIEDNHKFYVEDIEVYYGLKPKLPWMVHMQRSLLLQDQIHGLWQLPDYANVHKLSGLQCASQKSLWHHARPKDLAIS